MMEDRRCPHADECRLYDVTNVSCNKNSGYYGWRRCGCRVAWEERGLFHKPIKKSHQNGYKSKLEHLARREA
jgi:hypothetical protein